MSAKEWKPGCPTWEEGPDTPRARIQRQQVLAQIVKIDHRKLPSVKLVQGWHRDLFRGIAPHEDYLGNFRDLEKVPPCLQDMCVHVDGIDALPPEEVLDAVRGFMKEFKERIKYLDRMWRALKRAKTPFAVDQIVKTAAWSHGEWVRIHPFANGNGRTSRLWLNYVMSRYGFAPLPIRPRPDSPYSDAAEASMRHRDHTLMESVIWNILWESLRDKIEELFL